jgi:hypothetical protein
MSISTLMGAAASACPIEKARQMATQWQKSLSQEDVDAVVGLYEENAILNPTLHHKIMKTQGDRKVYFQHLFEKLKSRSVVYDDSHFRKYGDVVVQSGHYTFKGLQDGKKKNIPARMSFVYFGDECHIIDHHSSVMPE